MDRLSGIAQSIRIGLWFRTYAQRDTAEANHRRVCSLGEAITNFQEEGTLIGKTLVGEP